MRSIKRLVLMTILVITVGVTQVVRATDPTTSFTPPTPDNNSINSTGYIFINTSVSNAPNGTALLNWNNSLIGWWRLNEVSGTVAQDFSGSNRNGTLRNFNAGLDNGPSGWNSSGKYGNALAFDGVDDNVSLPSFAFTNTNGAITYESWTNSSLSSTIKTFISDGPASATVGYYWIYRAANTNDLVLQYANGTSTKAMTFSDYFQGLDNTWIHTVVVANYTNKSVTVYRNGDEFSSQTTDNMVFPSTNRVKYIGAWLSTFYRFSGKMDEVRLYNRELNSTEINASFDAGNYSISNNFTGLSDDTNYTATAYVQNQTGFVNSTGEYTFTVVILPPIISISSPQNGTYLNTSVYLNVSITNKQSSNGMNYSLDGAPNATLCSNCVSNSSLLTGLSQGAHNVTVWGKSLTDMTNSSMVNFTVNTSSSYCPSGSVYDVWNVTADKTCSDLNFTLNDYFVLYNGTLTLNNNSILLKNSPTIYNNTHLEISNTTLKYDDNILFGSGLITYGFINITNSTLTSWNSSTGMPYTSFGTYADACTSRPGIRYTIPYLNIKNSIINYSDYAGIFILGYASPKSALIENNTFYGNCFGIEVETDNPSSNITVRNNTILNSQFYGVSFNTAGNNILITENNISGTDVGIMSTYSKNITITKNNISNTTYNTDGYDYGIAILNSDNITISNNNLTDIGTSGFRITNATNITIAENYIDLMNVTIKNSSTITNDWTSPPSGISITKLAKGYGYVGEYDNYSIISSLESHNVSISSNLFGPNVSVLVRTDNENNFSQDLTNYWLISYNFPRLTGINRYYFSNNFTNVTSVVTPVNKTYSYYTPPHRIISNINQEPYAFYQDGNSANGTAWIHFYDYILERNNFSIRPWSYKVYKNGSVINMTDIPYDFYFYGNGTTFSLNKNQTVFSNGTTYLQLYNDTLEPNGYHTINMTVTPSSDNITVNITVWNTTGDYKVQFNESSTNTSNTVQYTIGDRQINSNYSVKVYWDNGTLFQDFNTLSNTTGYISYNSTGFDSSRYTVITQQNLEATVSCPKGWCFLAMNYTSKTLLQLDNMFSTDLNQGTYNSTTQKYETHVTGFTPNQNVNVTQKQGYYYYFSAPTIVNFVIETNPTITLNTGWNLVGNLNQSMTLSQELSNIGASATQASHYNKTTRTFVSTGSEIIPVGESFFVYVTNPTQWSG
ncbi:MAG: right-handed parallel beta-helix repeat-containing protein [Candidatus Dojkabacteria bacterium]|nr:right-handed parallel beta-helix repeat-containing protein [Candidatus Dojkabacteria bacterium]